MGSRRRVQVRRLAALTLVAALAVAGCSGDGDDGSGEDAAPTSGDTADRTAGTDGSQQTADGPVAPPTAPADIQAALGDRSASGGTSITVEADQAAFVLPSGNIACSVTAQGAGCQIYDKSYTPREDHMSTANLAGCSPADADVIRLAPSRGAWTCVDEPVRGQAAVTTGGWWVEEVDGETLDADGATLAVLPYGSTITVGPTSCTSAEAGVSCTNSEYGRSFTLARTSYNYG